jgi:DNA primase large subunit
LFDVSSSVYLFVRGKIDVTDKEWLRMNSKESQLALERSIHEAEAKLRISQRSKQAMQPTADHFSILNLWMESTFQSYVGLAFTSGG